jgi:hypothetical protein
MLHTCINVGGKKIWRLAQLINLLPSRSWSSMMGRWRTISRKTGDGGSGDGASDDDEDDEGTVSHSATNPNIEKETALKEVVQLVQSVMVDQQMAEVRQIDMQYRERR